MDRLICMSVLLIIVLFIRWWLVLRKLAIEKVKERTDEQKVNDINEALSLYVFFIRYTTRYCLFKHVSISEKVWIL